MTLQSAPNSPFPRRPMTPPRASQGIIRPIYAAVFDIDPQDGYEPARGAVRKWLTTHRSVLPYAATLSEGDFEIDRLRESDGVLAQWATNPADTITVARLQHREPLPGGRHDPARNWRTDITIERSDDAAWIATRIWFAGVASDERGSAAPRFIKDLWREGALSDLDILEPVSRNLEYEEEAHGLADLILDVDRDLPVVVVADGCPLDANRLADDSIGLAHVFKVSRTARLALMRALEFKFELAHGAGQTFFPRVDGAPPVAPGARFETVVSWRFGALVGPPAFANWLHEEMGRAVVLRLLNDPAHRTIESVRVVAIEAQRAVLSARGFDEATLRSQLELVNEERELLNLEYADVRRQMSELTERAEKYLSERTSLDEELRAERARNHSLNQEKVALLYALAAKNGSERIILDAQGVEALIAQQSQQQTVFDAVDQAKTLFALYGVRVVVSDEAFDGAMESPFRRPNEVLAVLLRLGFLWNDIRASGRALETAAHEVLHCTCSLHESQTVRNQYAGERAVTVDGVPTTLVKHLRLGSGNAEASLRIYFGDKDGELLIGHVGRHLTTAKTQ